MKIAAVILGVLGGIFGIIGALFAFFIGGVGAAFGEPEAGTVFGLGLAAIIISIVGIVGGALAYARPRIAGYMMVAAGILGFIAVSAAYIVAGPLLIVGGALALLASRQRPEEEVTTEEEEKRRAA